MPRYLVETRKATQNLGGRRWRNRYFLDADTTQEALFSATQLWQQGERLFHYTDTYCYAVYANLQGDVPFTPGEELPVDATLAFGTRTIAGLGEIAPSFCVARVDFAVAGSRPSRKFYRPMLREGDFNGDALTGTILQALAAGLSFITGGGVVDIDGQPWTVDGHKIVGVSSRRMGRDSFINVPSPPQVVP